MIGTLQGLKDYLGIEGDAADDRLTVALARGSELVKAYCRKALESTTYTDELWDGTGTDTLQVRAPIISVAAIKEFGTALTFGTNPTGNFDVIWYGPEGHLVRPYGIWIPRRRHYAITYDAGYTADTMPQIVEQAAYEYAALVNAEKDRVGINHKTTGQQTTEFSRDLPKHVRDGLDYYREVAMTTRVC